MANRTIKPSSSSDGFFQTPPIVPPGYTFDSSRSGSEDNSNPHATSDDVVLARILNLYLPREPVTVFESIHKLARRALLPSTLRLAVDAETNQPTLHPRTTFGEEDRSQPLRTAAGWQELKRIGHEEGLITVAYGEEDSPWNRRVHQFALNHLWTPSSAVTGCPMSMTDGAARLFSAHFGDPDGDQPGRHDVLREVYRRLVSSDPDTAWTSGQWMTERTGGSDVRGTETVARRLTQSEISHDAQRGRDRDAHGMPLGPWSIDGFKWFSSATDSEMALLLAQTGKGLGLFYVPMRRRMGHSDTPGQSLTELNGIRIQRLKNKLGTKALPTAELELKGVRGWLIGDEGNGVKEITTILNITRLYAAAASVAAWSRGLSICRAYTKVRKTQGSLLQDNRQHLRWMADETVKYWASVHLTFFGIALQGAIEQDWSSAAGNTRAAQLIPPDKRQAMTLLRLITPVLKARVSVASTDGLRACMECLGGIGYCENNDGDGVLNIAKIFRDTIANVIWEGTVSVMAEDVVRVVLDKRLAEGRVIEAVLGEWAITVLSICRPAFAEECAAVERMLQTLLALTQNTSKAELLWRGREALQLVEAVVCSCLLMFDAYSDRDEVARRIASRWILFRALPGDQISKQSCNWEEESAVDRRIFLGADTLPKRRLEKM